MYIYTHPSVKLVPNVAFHSSSMHSASFHTGFLLKVRQLGGLLVERFTKCANTVGAEITSLNNWMARKACR